MSKRTVLSRRSSHPPRRASRNNSRRENIPPPFQATFVVHKKIRWTAINSFTDTAITIQNVLQCFGVATTAVTGAPLFTSMKMKSVEMWAPASSATQIRIDFEYIFGAGGFAGPSKVFSDATMGTAFPAHLKARTPSRGIQSQWLQSNSVAFFQFSGPADTVIEVEATFVFQDATNVAASQTLVAAVPGATYIRSLDGLSLAAGNFTPTSYTQY